MTVNQMAPFTAIRGVRLLIEEFGAKNVETALTFIAEQCTPTGLRVVIHPTPEIVRALLEACHKRLDVGEVRACGDAMFYHHPNDAGKVKEAAV